MRASTASLLVPGLKKRSIFSRGMRNCSTWLGLRSPMMDAMASRDSAPCSESLRILIAWAWDGVHASIPMASSRSSCSLSDR